MESKAVGPHVLGYASSTVKNNKYIDAPIISAMSGAEKAIVLGDSKVIMQNVRAGDQVGKIVLGSYSKGAAKLEGGGCASKFSSAIYESGGVNTPKFNETFCIDYIAVAEA